MIGPVSASMQHAGKGFDPLGIVASHPERFPFLLQSNAPGPQGRFDLLFGFPGECLTLWPDGRLEGPHAKAGRFLDALDAWYRSDRVEQPERKSSLPFTGGWFLYLGYELAGEIEPKLALPKTGTPIAMAVRVPSAVIVDRTTGSLRLIDESDDPDRLQTMREALHAAGCRNDGIADRLPEPARVTEADPAEYLEGVLRILHYIREGDVFQVNLSRGWELAYAQPPDPVALYGALRTANPGPFNGLALFEELTILSSSPERLIEVSNGRIRTRPIAGTRPRGRNSEDDARLSAELIAHPKERAEHVMLIDLERNDLGRVSRTGSVHVSEFMTLEHYAHVHHIVSEVTGTLRPETTPGKIIEAVFPGGTITGCPKVRCMEIIAEIEGEGRGAYTGSMGYLDHRGHMDLNILIRTLVQEGDRVRFRTGAGIVADSVPERELDETRAKALGLLKALGVA